MVLEFVLQYQSLHSAKIANCFNSNTQSHSDSCISG
jgi:hypothetical protein